MLGAMTAPAVVKAENLMKIFVPPEKKILTLGSLAADYDGDAMLANMEYIDNFSKQMAIFRDRINRNAVFGKHAPVDYLKAYTNPQTTSELAAMNRLREDYDVSSRRMVTPRRGGQPSKSQLGLQLPIGRIHPQLIRAKG
jgi:hypothetical protein